MAKRSKTLAEPETTLTKTSLRLRNIGKNCLLIFLSLALALGACEAVLRFYNPFGFRIKGDNIILPVNKKEIRYHAKGTKLDEVVIHQNNSLGFTGPEPPPDFNNWLTLVTVGGSTTECLEIAQKKTWPYLLGVSLQQRFPRLWVNNAGLSGQSTFGHYVLMRDFIRKLKPKVVVFLVGINDVGISDAREFDTRTSTKITFRSWERFLAAMAYRSEVASLLLNLERYYFPKSVMGIGQKGMRELDLTKLPKLAMSAEKEAALKRTHEEKYVPLYEVRLKRLLKITRQNGMDPILVTQPVVYGKLVDDVTGVDFSDKAVGYGLNGEVGWDILNLYNDVTRKVGREEGVLVVDLARELPQSSLYYYDLMHYSNQGNARVAAILARHLTPYLAEKYHSYYKPPLDPHTAAAPVSQAR
jgi:lysophospholipase L1-like esterase